MTPTDAFVACFLALDGSATFLLHERMRLRAAARLAAVPGSAGALEASTAPLGPDHADWMRTSQVRAALGLGSDTSVKRWAADGRLRCVRLATGERLYDPVSVAECKAAMNGDPR